MSAAINHYEPSPTPSRAFPALKTPPPMIPERMAGGFIGGDSLPEEVEAISLENGEDLLALCAQMGRLRRRLAALSE